VITGLVPVIHVSTVIPPAEDLLETDDPTAPQMIAIKKPRILTNLRLLIFSNEPYATLRTRTSSIALGSAVARS